jgi:hypothetical protein
MFGVSFFSFDLWSVVFSFAASRRPLGYAAAALDRPGEFGEFKGVGGMG